MANGGIKLYAIDGKKLEALISKRGLVKINLSEEAGYARQYLTGCVRKNTIAMPMIKFLENNYNIKYDDYKVIEESPTAPIEIKEPKVIKISDMTNQELYQLIYSATFEATKMAFKEI